MIFTISAHVTVDFSGIGGTKTVVPGKLTYDDVGVPTQVEFEYPGGDANLINKVLAGNFGEGLVGQHLTIATHHRQQVLTTLETINHIGFGDRNTIIFRGHVGASQTVDPAKAGLAATAWHFKLANLKLGHGDEWVQYPPPPNQPDVVRGPQSLSRIRFIVNNREWTLTDEMFRSWKNNPNPSVPVESGTLTTPYVANDTDASVAAVAGDIEQLLTVALGRKVRFVSMAKVDAEGDLIAANSRAGHVEPFNIGGTPPVDNWHGGVLRTFVEGAQPIVAANRGWWYETLGYY